MKKFLFLITVFLSVLLANCATEKRATKPAYMPQEKCDAPVWNVGDSWRYRNDDKKEWEYKVLGIEEFKNSKIYVVEDRYGVYKKGFDVKTLQFMVDIGPDGKKIVPMTDWTFSYDFPLYVGKKWEYMVRGKDTNSVPKDYLYIYKVLSFENITVPAGTFKAFKIEREQRGFTQMSYIRSYRWFSQEVKREVKFQYGSQDGSWRLAGQNYELISFKLEDKQSSRPAIKLPPKEIDTSSTPQLPPSEKHPVTPMVTSPLKTNVVIVTGTFANIRSGTGIEFPIITTVKKGDKLTLLGEYSEWLNVRLENGQEGWIDNKFTK